MSQVRTYQQDVEIVKNIQAVPTILEMVCRATGMGFAAVARVSEDRWIACSVLDEIDFGLKAGGELKVESTICHEIRQSLEPVVIEHVAEEAIWCNHATPAKYGFQSYISMPIILADGAFFGTLCAIDPRPARIRTTEIIGMFRLFAELIGKHVDGAQKLVSTNVALQAAERSNDALQRFASIASHDLREPLRQVSIFTRLLAKKHAAADAESQRYFDFVESGAARMGRILDGLMAYTHIDSMGPMPLERAGLEEVLQEALQGLQLALQESDAVVTHDSLPHLTGNQSQLAELLQNLINNALKYRSTAAPRIHVSAALHGNEWVVSVSDNGIGVAPENRTKIFQVFTRLHGQEISGVGLGLAFCAKIIELHKGRIWVEANPASPSGSVFRFALPA